MKLVRGQVDKLPLLRVPTGQIGPVGKGTLYTYTVYVSPSLRNWAQAFAEMVARTLGDKRSWIKSGKVAFQQVAKGGGTQVILATPETVDKLCVPLETEGYVSCNVGSKVVINFDRWMHGVPHWTGTVQTYRQMVINHEWGHRIGHGHGYCPGEGLRAPVMQQQTLDLKGCRENSWPLASEF